MKLVARENGREIPVEVERHGNSYRVRVGEKWIEADFVKVGRYVRSLRLSDGTQYSLVAHHHGTTHEIAMRGAKFSVDIIDPLAAKRRRREDEVGATGVVTAIMPGRVVRLLVAQGETVTKGTGLLILEAMKMENEIQAPVDGTVDTIFVEAGQTVEGGADLVHIA